jgi:hypothetical protein
MSDFHGRFIWYELMTPDPDGAQRFYADLIGWTPQPMPPMEGAPPYTVFNNGPDGVAGMMPLLPEMKAAGVPPNWTGYIGVDDCDAAAEKVKALGGAVQRPPMDIPGIGRFAIVADPAGAVFAIMRPVPPEGSRPPPDREAVGQAGWHELYGAAPEEGFSFYAELFGWTKAEAMPMGEMGTYQLFANQDGQIGGMMKKPPQAPVACWTYYFRVPDADAAAKKAADGGAQLMMGPMDVPNGERVFQAADPQGAVFAAVARKG